MTLSTDRGALQEPANRLALSHTVLAKLSTDWRSSLDSARWERRRSWLRPRTPSSASGRRWPSPDPSRGASTRSFAARVGLSLPARQCASSWWRSTRGSLASCRSSPSGVAISCRGARSRSKPSTLRPGNPLAVVRTRPAPSGWDSLPTPRRLPRKHSTEWWSSVTVSRTAATPAVSRMGRTGPNS